jgi:drug/metabolite transporter (DMT)-like permease
VFDDTLMVLYLAGAYALLGAIAYTAIASASRNWRQRPAREVVAISALVGVAGQILNWTGLSLIPLLPFIRMLPRHVSTVLGIAMPGIIIGVAILIWSATRRAKAPEVAPGADRVP